MKAYSRALVAGLSAYLVLTLLFAIYSEYRYRRELNRHLMVMGKEAFIQSQRLNTQVKGEFILHEDWKLLKFTPPFGWIIRWRVEYLERLLIFASRNLSRPERERFADGEEARRFGFNPQKRSDAELYEALFPQLR